MSNTNLIEEIFDSCLPVIGGRKLVPVEDSFGKQADYLFENLGWVVEHKALLEDQTETFFSKVRPIVKEWMDSHSGELPPGVSLDPERKMVVDIQACLPEMAEKFNRFLRDSVEGIVEQAHRQIRSTVQRYGLGGKVKGAILVCNERNNLHGKYPRDYVSLVLDVMKKRTSEGQPRFPYLHGIVYCSYLTMKSKEENLGFWFFGPEDDRDLVKLQLGLKIAFAQHFEQTTGEHFRVTVADVKLGEKTKAMLAPLAKVGFGTYVKIVSATEQMTMVVPHCAVDENGNALTALGQKACEKQLLTGTVNGEFVFECPTHGRVAVLPSEQVWQEVLQETLNAFLVPRGHFPIEGRLGVLETQSPLIRKDAKFHEVIG